MSNKTRSKTGKGIFENTIDVELFGESDEDGNIIDPVGIALSVFDADQKRHAAAIMGPIEATLIIFSILDALRDLTQEPLAQSLKTSMRKSLSHDLFLAEADYLYRKATCDGLTHQRAVVVVSDKLGVPKHLLAQWVENGFLNHKEPIVHQNGKSENGAPKQPITDKNEK